MEEAEHVWEKMVYEKSLFFQFWCKPKIALLKKY